MSKLKRGLLFTNLFIKEAEDCGHDGSLQCLCNRQCIVKNKEIGGTGFKGIKGHYVEGVLKAKDGHEKEKGPKAGANVLIIGGGELA